MVLLFLPLVVMLSKLNSALAMSGRRTHIPHPRSFSPLLSPPPTIITHTHARKNTMQCARRETGSCHCQVTVYTLSTSLIAVTADLCAI
ncbi:MAG: hypothetical protein BYD32DRAFT_429714 [Podila humilis]|nr:MAG: hypothetical protein BYD32DRAFT_429714 [Podila humilis]